MAITKIHPIKSTLKYALDYIMNDEKTDQSILITSHACGHETAYLEFQNTRKEWNSSVKNLARHFIQSFDPNDNLTPESAHEIGQKLIGEALDGKYEFVLTTHIDKGHIHNHIIWNNVSFEDGKAYISNKKSYHQLRAINDKLCREYGLHVLENNNKTKGKSYKEYHEHKKGSSWKSQLKYAIDNAIKRSKDWDDFLKIMKNFGYEIKEGKHISFRAKEQTRFTRAKTIGDYYTEDKIKARIKNWKLSKNHSLGIDKVIDIKTNEKAKNFKGYEIWAKQYNIKNISKTLAVMKEMKVNNVNELYVALEIENMDLVIQSRKVKDVEAKIKSLATKGKYLSTYKQYHKLYKTYQNAQNKAEIYRANTDKIVLFEAAKKALGDDFNFSELEQLPIIKEDLKVLENQKQREIEKYKEQKNKTSKLEFLRSNLEVYMGWKELNIENKREH
ncbi:MAG: relaxase/mobilization nuclease domain-containing protein [Peptoniphilaceae bacterium]